MNLNWEAAIAIDNEFLHRATSADLNRREASGTSPLKVFCGISGGACEVTLPVAQQVENATIVFIVCDRRVYLSTGVFPAWGLRLGADEAPLTTAGTPLKEEADSIVLGCTLSSALHVRLACSPFDRAQPPVSFDGLAPCRRLPTCPALFGADAAALAHPHAEQRNERIVAAAFAKRARHPRHLGRPLRAVRCRAARRPTGRDSRYRAIKQRSRGRRSGPAS
jgi:hypothetical protein